MDEAQVKPKIAPTWEGSGGCFELYYAGPPPETDSERDLAADVEPAPLGDRTRHSWRVWHPEGSDEPQEMFTGAFAWGYSWTLQGAWRQAEAVLKAVGYEFVAGLEEAVLLHAYPVLLLDAKRCEWNDYLDDEGNATVPVAYWSVDPMEAVRAAFRGAEVGGCEPPPRDRPYLAEVLGADGKASRWAYEIREEIDGVPAAEPLRGDKVDYAVMLLDAADHEWEGFFDDEDEERPAIERTFPARSHAGAVLAAVAERHEQELGCDWDADYVFAVTAPGCLPRLLTYRVTDVVRSVPTPEPVAG